MNLFEILNQPSLFIELLCRSLIYRNVFLAVLISFVTSLCFFLDFNHIVSKPLTYKSLDIRVKPFRLV